MGKWNRNLIRKICFFVILFTIGTIVSACMQEKEAGKKKLAFEICEEEKLPDELKKLIDEKKESPFQLTFRNSAHLYIVVGYGEQPRGEYVAAVRELYETEKGVYADTTLISISYAKNRQVGEPSTYPYIVLRCRQTNKTVFFL